MGGKEAHEIQVTSVNNCFVLSLQILYRTVHVGGKETRQIQETPESDWRDDEVMQRVLLCIRALTDHRKVSGLLRRRRCRWLREELW